MEDAHAVDEWANFENRAEDFIGFLETLMEIIRIESRRRLFPWFPLTVLKQKLELVGKALLWKDESFVRFCGQRLWIRPMGRFVIHIPGGDGEPDNRVPVCSLADLGTVVNSRLPPDVRQRCQLLGCSQKLEATATSATDTESSRIASLEQELAILRQQMAHIMAMKEGEMGTSTEASNRSPSPCGSHDSGIASEETATVIPPPPPPPPPDLFSRPAPLLASIPKAGCRAGGRQDKAPSMMDVLKELKSVILRPVRNRSPGGTPSRPEQMSDRGSFIALALKKKFAGVAADSPASDKENQAESSWEESPDDCVRKTRQHRRRSSLSFRQPKFVAEESN